jgi:hypothetical protein
MNVDLEPRPFLPDDYRSNLRRRKFDFESALLSHGLNFADYAERLQWVEDGRSVVRVIFPTVEGPLSQSESGDRC